MPLYEYGCRSCGKTVEIIQKFSDSPLTECPECGGTSLEKLISQTGFQLKGGGWYATDYRKTSASQASNPLSSGTSDASSSAKPAEKSAPSAPSTCGTGGCGNKNGGCT